MKLIRFFENFIFDLVFAVIDSSFWESVFGTDVADLVIEIKFLIPFYVFFRSFKLFLKKLS